MDAFLGRWKVDRSKDENVTEYYVKSGRKREEVEKQKDTEITEELTKDGNKYTLVITTGDKISKPTVFEIGKECELHSPYGLSLKGVFTIEGSKVLGKFSLYGTTVESLREMKGDMMAKSTTSKGTTMTQYFNRM